MEEGQPMASVEKSVQIRWFKIAANGAFLSCFIGNRIIRPSLISSSSLDPNVDFCLFAFPFKAVFTDHGPPKTYMGFEGVYVFLYVFMVYLTGFLGGQNHKPVIFLWVLGGQKWYIYWLNYHILLLKSNYFHIGKYTSPMDAMEMDSHSKIWFFIM